MVFTCFNSSLHMNIKSNFDIIDKNLFYFFFIYKIMLEWILTFLPKFGSTVNFMKNIFHPTCFFDQLLYTQICHLYSLLQAPQMLLYIKWNSKFWRKWESINVYKNIHNTKDKSKTIRQKTLGRLKWSKM